MATRLFVGNLPYSVTDQTLGEKFASAGTVVSANVITDRMSGRSKGFGFVEMGSDEEAKKAIETLNGADMEGRPLVVNEARPRPEGAGGEAPAASSAPAEEAAPEAGAEEAPAETPAEPEVPETPSEETPEEPAE